MKLKPYPAYKDSGVDSLGEVPDEWVVCNLKRIISAKSGVDIKSESGDTPLYGANGVIGYSDTMSQPDGALLIGRVGSAGELTFANEGCAVSDNALIINSIDSIERPYIFHVLKSLNLEVDISKNAQPLITATTLLRKVVTVPLSQMERVGITTFLDRETAKLDTLISKQEQLIDRFNERIIATVMGALLSTDTQYIRLVHVCEVISRPVNQSSENAFTRLGVLNRGRGLFKREETDSEDMGDSDFFWVKNGDLVLSGQFAWEGSVAMANDEHEGCVVSHRFPIIKGKAGIVLTEYLLALFMTSHGDFLLNENSRGSAGRNRPLNMSLLLKEKIPIASMAIQNKVANLLRLQKKLKDKASIQIDLLKEHRTALISAAVTGKIDVREAA